MSTKEGSKEGRTAEGRKEGWHDIKKRKEGYQGMKEGMNERTISRKEGKISRKEGRKEGRTDGRTEGRTEGCR